MDYKEIRNIIEELGTKHYEDFTKAIISFEKGINDVSALNKIYQEFMNNDTASLINEDFDYMIDDLRENGEIKDIPFEDYKKENDKNQVKDKKQINDKKQVEDKEEKKESILGAIKKYQMEDKEKSKDKKDLGKENSR